MLLYVVGGLNGQRIVVMRYVGVLLFSFDIFEVLTHSLLFFHDFLCVWFISALSFLFRKACLRAKSLHK